MATQECPCGYLGDPSGRCHCTAEQVQRYRQRLSGPLLDRIDIHIEVPRLPRQTLLSGAGQPTETSAEVQARVIAAHTRQMERCGKPNALLGNRELERVCPLTEADRRLLEQAMDRLGLSARAYHRILRVARSVADLEGSEGIRTAHLTEAIFYRRLDRAVST